jgi:Domain of unknown function (DUF4397)
MTRPAASGRRPYRTVIRVGVAAAIGVAAGLAGASPAPAAEPSYVRLGHFSPDTPKVDVYLTSFSRPDWKLTLKGVGYGALSPYERLQPDLYTVAMRAAGAAPSSPPVLTINVKAVAGQAYTVAGVGPYAGLGLTILRDDLSLPPKGKARVRIIEASARAKAVSVTMSNGVSISPSLDFAKTSGYATVPAGSWTLRVQSTSRSDLQATTPVGLAAGDVYTVLVLDSDSGGLTLQTRTDAKSMAVTPAGGVETGLGGTAPRPGRGVAWLPIGLTAAGGALLAAAGVRFSRSGRRSA